MTDVTPGAAELPEPAETPESAVTPGAPAADLPVSDPAEGWQRLHPLSPLLRGGLFVLVIAGIVLANLRDRLVAIVLVDVPWAEDGGEGDLLDVLIRRDLVLIAIVVVVAVLLLVVVFSWLGWRMHTFRISDDAVESRSGILFRQHRRAPLDRIQGVNLQRPMLARLLGLTMLEVSTAGQDGKVRLNYLSHRDAKLVREQILADVAARRQGKNPVSGQAPSLTHDLALSPQDPALSAIPDVLAHRVNDFVDLDLDPGAGSSLVTVSPGRILGSTVLSWPTIIFSIAIAGIIVAGSVGETFVLFMLVPAAITFVGVTVSGFTRSMNFHLSLSEHGVRVSSGLISTVTETIPRGRIHAIGVSQPLGWRPFGWWHVRITTAGLNPASNGNARAALNTMLPVGKIDDVVRVLDVLMPGHGMSPDQVREAMLGTAGDFLGSSPRAAWILWFARRRNGLKIAGAGTAAEPHLRLRRGFATRLLVLVPLVRVQSIELDRGLLHRGLGLAALTARTVLGPVPTRIAGLTLEDARSAFDDIAVAAVDASKNDTGTDIAR